MQTHHPICIVEAMSHMGSLFIMSRLLQIEFQGFCHAHCLRKLGEEVTWPILLGRERG